MKIKVARKPADAYQHGNLKEALVQAGLKLLTEGGVESLSLRGAAQLAGVSHAAPYRHFRDKDALVAAIAERGFRLLTASLREGLARCESPDARARVVALGLGYFAFATSHPAYLRVIFGGVLGAKDPSPELAEAGQEAFATLRDVVVDGLARGELGGGDADELALGCWSMIHGFATLSINGAAPVADPTAVARKMLALLGTGLFRPSP